MTNIRRDCIDERIDGYIDRGKDRPIDREIKSLLRVVR